MICTITFLNRYVLHLIMHAWICVNKLCAKHVSAVNASTLFWNQKFHISHQISHRQTQFPTIYWHLSRCESVFMHEFSMKICMDTFPYNVQNHVDNFYWAKATKKQLSNCLLGWMLRMLSGFAARHQHQAEHWSQVSGVEFDDRKKRAHVIWKICNMKTGL